MHDRNQMSEILDRPSRLGGLADRPLAGEREKVLETDEETTAAFGYLRGLHDRGLAVEFRFRDGNRVWFPYSWLGPIQFNPSVGLLLRFTGDLVTLVLIRGSNLDAPIRQNAVNLTDRGLQRQRITFIREMEEEELRKTGESGPTIDRIDMASFETQEDLQAWLKKIAPAFLRSL
jgi:hypothetical protein